MTSIIIIINYGHVYGNSTGKTARVLKGLTAPPGYILAFQKNAWMDVPLMQQWTNEIWFKYTKKERSLLVIDQFRAHLADEVTYNFSYIYTFM